MPTQTMFAPSDLVLRVSGGERDGELVPVETRKCCLDAQVNRRQATCAIFRGPHGVAVRSYDKAITFNGASATVHWLEQGDQIEFGNQLVVEVAQIGSIETNESIESVAAEPQGAASAIEDTTTAFTADTIESALESNSPLQDEQVIEEPETKSTDSFVSEPEQPVARLDAVVSMQDTIEREEDEMDMESEATNDNVLPGVSSESVACATPEDHQTETTYASTPTQIEFEPAGTPVETDQSNSRFDERLDLIESRIREIQRQNMLSQANAEKMGERLDELCGQLSQLVSLADRGDFKDLESSTESQLPIESALDSAENDGAKQDAVNETASNSQPEADGGYGLAQNLYSYADDDSDDEKIITFNPEASEPAEHVPTVDHVEITDPVPVQSKQPPSSEMESRLAEMERVFGANKECESDLPESDSAESLAAPQTARAILPTQPLGMEPESVLNSPPDSITEQTADDSPSSTFDTSTHSQNVGSESSAANSTPALEPTQLLDLAAPGSLASQLMQEVESSDATEMNDETEENNGPQLETESVGDRKENESVADLLARMKAEGQWSGVPDENDESKDHGVVEPVESVAVPVAPAFEQPPSEDQSEPDVEDYMSQLLNRMRGGAPEAKPKPVQQPKPEKVEPEELAITPPVNPLRPEEFVPKRKATKIESFDAMRELANSSARSAVMQSEEGRRKALGYLQVGIAVASFLMTIYYMTVASKALFDVSFCIGLVCLGISGFLGHRYYLTIKHNEELGNSQPAANNKSTESKQPAERAIASAPAAEQPELVQGSK